MHVVVGTCNINTFAGQKYKGQGSGFQGASQDLRHKLRGTRYKKGPRLKMESRLRMGPRLKKETSVQEIP